MKLLQILRIVLSIIQHFQIHIIKQVKIHVIILVILEVILNILNNKVRLLDPHPISLCELFLINKHRIGSIIYVQLIRISIQFIRNNVNLT